MHWKPIDGFEGLYEVSERGDIKSHYSGRILVPAIVKGYWNVGLVKNGRRFNKIVHRVVATAFLGKPEKGQQVNHIDGNKLNNHFSNLEWTTCLLNVRHAINAGLMASKTGAANRFAKITEDAVAEIRRLWAEGIMQKDIAARFSVTPNHIYRIVNGRRWKHSFDS